MIKLHEHYLNILNLAITSPIEKNERTGENIKVIEYPVNMVLDIRDNIVPTIGVRKTYPKSAAAEIAWFLQGKQDASFVNKYTPFWSKFIEDIDTPNGTIQGVKAAYGYRWRNHFGVDQIADAIEILKKDPTNRRVYVNAWDSKEDGKSDIEQLNVPCPVGFNLCIVNGRLNSSLTLRSSDVFVGLPYDIMGHAYLVAAIASSLNVEVGFISINLNHAHLYEAHWDYALEAIVQPIIVPEIKMPKLSIEEICADPDKYVSDIIIQSKEYKWPSFNPKPHIVSTKNDNTEIINFLNKTQTNKIKNR